MKHSNSLYSPEDELFHEQRKSKRSRWWKWALALVLVLLFVYRSTRPVMRLSAEPPPSFYDYNRTWDRQKRQEQRRLARAYWDVAVQRIQRHYSPKSSLPADPPPQFHVSRAAQPSAPDVTAARVHYWFRLREVWSEGDAWDVSYGWNTEWVGNTLNSIPQYIPRPVAAACQSVIDVFIDIAKKISYH